MALHKVVFHKPHHSSNVVYGSRRLHSWEAAVAGVLPVPIYADFSASVAYCGLGIIDAAELPWCYALDGRVGMNVVPFVVEGDCTLHEMIHMAYLELDGCLHW